ncbi:MAG: hypothetical protein LBE20_04625 [Deltaproteobacteria bacterium]|jgi:hypothetical protein|nr:hypothetical protein [Deltaproteobacteria bacterium]
MIDPRIETLADDYIQSWNRQAIKEPLLYLDYSWQSVTTLGLLAGNLFKTGQLNPLAALSLRSISAYLTVLAHNCWQTFATEVMAFFDNQGQICLSGKLADGEVMFFEVSAKVFEIYAGAKELPPTLQKYHDFLLSYGENQYIENYKFLANPYHSIKNYLLTQLEKHKQPIELFPIIEKYRRLPQATDDLLVLFAYGLFYGFSAFGNEVCKNRELSKELDAIEKVTKFLAETCVNYANYCFPDNQLAQVAELYLVNLIYPPIFMAEEFLLQQATHGLVGFIKEYNLSAEQVLELCHDLMQMPDFLISSVALVVFTAVAKQTTQQALISASLKSIQLGTLRPAVLLARRELLHEDDWAMQKVLTENDLAHFRVERDLGFLAWLCLPEKSLIKVLQSSEAGPSSAKIIQALLALDYQTSERLLFERIIKNPDEVDFKIQLVFLKIIVAGIFIDMPQLCRELVEKYDLTEYYILYKLWACAEMFLGESELAERHLVSALEHCPEDELEYSDIAHLLFVINQNQGQLNKAEQYSVLAFEKDKSVVRQAVIRYGWLMSNKREAEAMQILNKLFRLAPFEKSLFGEFIQRDL